MYPRAVTKIPPENTALAEKRADGNPHLFVITMNSAPLANLFESLASLFSTNGLRPVQPASRRSSTMNSAPFANLFESLASLFSTSGLRPVQPASRRSSVSSAKSVDSPEFPCATRPASARPSSWASARRSSVYQNRRDTENNSDSEDAAETTRPAASRHSRESASAPPCREESNDGRASSSSRVFFTKAPGGSWPRLEAAQTADKAATNSEPLERREIQLFEKIGQGSTSVVHRARYRQPKKCGQRSARAHHPEVLALATRWQEVCAKVAWPADLQQAEHCRREVRLLQELQCEHLLTYRDTFQHEYEAQMALWLLVEYLECGSAVDLLQWLAAPLSEPQISYILKIVLSALAFLHARKMAHGEVRASNVLVGATGVVKLAAVGFSWGLHHSPDAAPGWCRGFVRPPSEPPLRPALTPMLPISTPDSASSSSVGAPQTLCFVEASGLAALSLDQRLAPDGSWTPHTGNPDIWATAKAALHLAGAGEAPRCVDSTSDREIVSAQLLAMGCSASATFRCFLTMLYSEPNGCPAASELLRHPLVRAAA